MSEEPYFDRLLHQYRLPPSHPDYSAGLNHPSGHEIRRKAQDQGDPYSVQTDSWYPGLLSYMPAESNTSAAYVPSHSHLSNHRLPDILAVGKRETSRDDLQHLDQLTADRELGCSMSGVQDSGRTPLMNAYELSASVEPLGGASEPGTVTNRTSARTNSERSSFLDKFGHLKPLIDTTACVPDQAAPTPLTEDLSYLCNLIEPGIASNSLSVTSTSPALHSWTAVVGSPTQEDFSYLRKIVAVGNVLPPVALVSPSPSTPLLAPTSSLSTLSIDVFSLSISLTPPVNITPSIIATAPNTSLSVVAAQDASLPLPHMPIKDRDLQVQERPPTSYTHEIDAHYSRFAQFLSTSLESAAAPPLPPESEEHPPQ